MKTNDKLKPIDINQLATVTGGAVPQPPLVLPNGSIVTTGLPFGSKFISFGMP